MSLKYQLINDFQLDPIFTIENRELTMVDVVYTHLPTIGKYVSGLVTKAGRPVFGFHIDPNASELNTDLNQAIDKFYEGVNVVSETAARGRRNSDHANLNAVNSQIGPNLPSYFYRLSPKTVLFLEPCSIKLGQDLFGFDEKNEGTYLYYNPTIISLDDSIIPNDAMYSPYTPNHILSTYNLFNQGLTIPYHLVAETNGVLTTEVIDFINSRYNLNYLASQPQTEK